ncbi:DUF2804 domain-containing protein [Flaviflexus equikiangi]|uniref:DUF2804 domain-containing protein n=1 Tax=Flaviflexus equikiangi TaxID=2758573 RepID=UPI0015F65AE6|nr:DUF2804 domain-containing protein [Flaviflexus equikiangi]
MSDGERELTQPVPLVAPTGGLNPDAVGWTRHPMHDTSSIANGPRRAVWGRNKRWEYWLITTPRHLISLTVSDIDYVASHTVWVYDMEGERRLDVTAIVPFARGAVLPPSLGDGPARGGSMRFGRVLPPGPGRMRAMIDPLPQGTRLRGEGQARGDVRPSRLLFDVTAHRAPEHESLGVVVPWSQSRFQYTVKETALPATGWLEVDGERFDLPAGESWAILDHGRGRWPYAMEWNWAAASGMVGSRAIGLQFGGRWTDGTGSRENAITVDGRLYPLHEDIAWDYVPGAWDQPWHLKSPSVDLWLEPLWDHDAVTDLGVLAMKAHQIFGFFHGTVTVDGHVIQIDRMLGFAEDVRNRW